MLYKYEENGEKTEKCDDKIGQVEKNAHKAEAIHKKRLAAPVAVRSAGSVFHYFSLCANVWCADCF